MPIEVRTTAVFDKWLARVADQRAVARIQARIARLVDGNSGDVKPAGEGVSEMRINYGPGYRLYYVGHGPALIILLCGGDKTTQAKDIASAKELARELDD
jgi:putative addiction module killer protein